MDSIPGLGRFHMPQRNSANYWAWVLQLLKPMGLKPVLLIFLMSFSFLLFRWGDSLSSRSLICSAPPNLLLFPSGVFFMDVIVFFRSDCFSFFVCCLFIEVLTMFLHSSKFSKHLMTMILNSLSGELLTSVSFSPFPRLFFLILSLEHIPLSIHLA